MGEIFGFLYKLDEIGKWCNDENGVGVLALTKPSHGGV